MLLVCASVNIPRFPTTKFSGMRPRLHIHYGGRSARTKSRAPRKRVGGQQADILNVVAQPVVGCRSFWKQSDSTEKNHSSERDSDFHFFWADRVQNLLHVPWSTTTPPLYISGGSNSGGEVPPSRSNNHTQCRYTFFFFFWRIVYILSPWWQNAAQYVSIRILDTTLLSIGGHLVHDGCLFSGLNTEIFKSVNQVLRFLLSNQVCMYVHILDICW